MIQISESRKGISFTNKHKGNLSKSHMKPIKVINLLTGEVREFPCAYCDECAEYLGYKNKSVCQSILSSAVLNNEGLFKRKTFKIEYI